MWNRCEKKTKHEARTMKRKERKADERNVKKGRKTVFHQPRRSGKKETFFDLLLELLELFRLVILISRLLFLLSVVSKALDAERCKLLAHTSGAGTCLGLTADFRRFGLGFANLGHKRKK